jgi:hypothetical protein
MRSCSLLIQWVDSIRYSDDQGKTSSLPEQLLRTVFFSTKMSDHEKNYFIADFHVSNG